MKSLFLLSLIFLSTNSFSQSRDEQDIRKLMNDQVLAWNKGSIEEFMRGYWNNDSVMFVGKNGISYGYTTVLNNYKRNYRDTVQMGKLSYTLLKLDRLSAEYYLVIGKFFLKRSVGDLGGIYSLVLRKIKGKWFIISDHTS
ncbi:MAG: YybH family protein [Chitinophagales bacterium]